MKIGSLQPILFEYLYSMKKILAFAGSNSSTSINHQLILAISKMITSDVEVIKLTNYPLPIFSADLEKAQGYPEPLSALLEKIKTADGIIISVNEHNGAVSAFFKNTFDWLSRIEYKFLADKKILLMSASTGKRGALSARTYAEGVIPRYDGEVVAGFNFPSFAENFSVATSSITNEPLKEQTQEAVAEFLKVL